LFRLPGAILSLVLLQAALVGLPKSRGGEAPLRPPEQPWFPPAPPLPAPAGEVIRVSSAAGLIEAAGRVKAGGTILLADGHYRMARHVEIKTDGVTLRGASGEREKVVLDGGGTLGEMIRITGSSGVTVADLTVRNVRWNGIKINSETNVQKVTLHNCILHNIWQRGVKGVRVPEKDRERIRPSGCKIQYCLFTNDRPKQFSDDPADTAENYGGDYIGGIDVMYAKGWTISDNVFRGIQGRNRQARGAVFIWHHSADCVVERNIILDCDSGICLGNSHLGDSTVHCTRFIVRNNFITRAPENGILADYTRDCRILNNTVHDPGSRLGRLIRLVHDNDGLRVLNNLLSGPPIRKESGSRMEIRQNLEGDFTRLFVDPAGGNLHLKAEAAEVVDRALPLAEVREDIDRQVRGGRPDVGGDEWVKR
jgi:parallel beta helix pectate lyase-like protein